MGSSIHRGNDREGALDAVISNMTTLEFIRADIEILQGFGATKPIDANIASALVLARKIKPLGAVNQTKIMISCTTMPPKELIEALKVTGWGAVHMTGTSEWVGPQRDVAERIARERGIELRYSQVYYSQDA